MRANAIHVPMQPHAPAGSCAHARLGWRWQDHGALPPQTRRAHLHRAHRWLQLRYGCRLHNNHYFLCHPTTLQSGCSMGDCSLRCGTWGGRTRCATSGAISTRTPTHSSTSSTGTSGCSRMRCTTSCRRSTHSPRIAFHCRPSHPHHIPITSPSNDRDRLAESRKELGKLLTEPELQACPVLVLANKQDLPHALPGEDVEAQLGMQRLGDSRPWRVQSCCAVDGMGLEEAMEWLSSTLMPSKGKA